MSSLTDALDALEIPFITEGHHHCRAGWVQIDHECSPGGHYRLGINIGSLGCSCWSCGRQSLYEVLLEASGKPSSVVYGIVKALRGGRGIEIGDAVRRVERREVELPKGVADLTNAHKQYLAQRGLDPDAVQSLWGVKGIANCADDRLAWRLFIPVVYQHEMVSWTTRTIAPDVALRYFSARQDQEKIPHKDLLYGEDHVRQSVLVVEGPFDVWSIGPGAVCTFGTAVRPIQVVRLARYPTRVVCFDAESGAQAKARELCDALEVFPGRTINIVLETGKDAGECSKEELAYLRDMLK